MDFFQELENARPYIRMEKQIDGSEREKSVEKPEHSQIDANGKSDVTQCDVISADLLKS
jgi:hypothetical protein